MTKTTKSLPTELAAIIQHVELHRAGWWDKAVQLLVQASIWLLNKPSSVADILLIIESEFHLTLSEKKINSVIEVLEKQDEIIRLHGPKFRIPDAKRIEFERDIKDVENVMYNARAYFFCLVEELCESLDPEATWNIFESKLLTPLIQEFGANAYRLITGEKLTADQELVRQFMDNFKPHHEKILNLLVIRFLDPNKDEVRKYVSCLLHAVYCVEASGLSENVIKKIKDITGKEINFRVFVDTNFLFSILLLHENPSNVAAIELNELIATLKTNPKVDLLVTSRTIEEAKRSISLAKTQLSEFPSGSNFTKVALKTGFSGIAKKFLEERNQRKNGFSVEEWLDPFLNDFVTIAYSKGIELFNEELDSYATHQEVLKDINYVMENQKNHSNKPKSYTMAEHDMILWHLVNDKRRQHSAFVESPSDAKDWILTLDYRLIQFDEFKRKKTDSSVPICVNPTTLMQLLQFWVPRTKEFEEAILGSLRLPVLFRKFDTEAEHISLRILNGIGRFEGSDQFTEETISRIVLNNGLRARIGSHENDEDDKALIRDKLVEELKTQNETEEGRVQNLEDKLKNRGERILALEVEKKDKEKQIEELKNRAAREETQNRIAFEKIEGIEEKQRKQEEIKKSWLACLKYILFLVVIILISCSAAWWLPDQIPHLTRFMGVKLTQIFILIVMFVLCHLILEWWVKRKKHMMNEFWLFRQINRFRVWLWSSVLLVIVSVIVILLANLIQQNIDNQSASVNIQVKEIVQFRVWLGYKNSNNELIPREERFKGSVGVALTPIIKTEKTPARSVLVEKIKLVVKYDDEDNKKISFTPKWLTNIHPERSNNEWWAIEGDFVAFEVKAGEVWAKGLAFKIVDKESDINTYNDFLIEAALEKDLNIELNVIMNNISNQSASCKVSGKELWKKILETNNNVFPSYIQIKCKPSREYTNETNNHYINHTFFNVPHFSAHFRTDLDSRMLFM